MRARHIEERRRLEAEVAAVVDVKYVKRRKRKRKRRRIDTNLLSGGGGGRRGGRGGGGDYVGKGLGREG